MKLRQNVAVKGVVKAGMKVGRVEIKHGKISVFAGREDSDEVEIEAAANEWDNVE